MWSTKHDIALRLSLITAMECKTSKIFPLFCPMMSLEMCLFGYMTKLDSTIGFDTHFNAVTMCSDDSQPS